MSPFEKIVRISQDIEKTLESDYGASGRGLHEKASSVEKKLSPGCMKKIRFIATIRNKVVHEDTDIAKKELQNVIKAAKEVNREIKKQGSGWSLVACVIAAIIAVLVFLAIKGC